MISIDKIVDNNILLTDKLVVLRYNIFFNYKFFDYNFLYNSEKIVKK